MENKTELIEQIKDLIGSNKTAKALQILDEKNISSIAKELTVLQARFSKIKSDQNLGVIEENAAETKLNQINLALLDLCDKISQPSSQNSSSQSKDDSSKNRKYLMIGGGIIVLIGIIFTLSHLMNSSKDLSESDKTEQNTRNDPGQTNGSTSSKTPSNSPNKTNTNQPERTAEVIMADIWNNMADIPAGTFTMGCTNEQVDCNRNEKPLREVTLSEFKLSKYEVTQEEWFIVTGEYPSIFSVCDRCPVENITFTEIQSFIEKLNALTGQDYHLPTEAQWEYAARGGQNLKFAGEQDYVGEVAWYAKNEGQETNPVGQKRQNGYGLYDMSGNVNEWCQDIYGTYPITAQNDPKGPFEGSSRVIRGGSWGNDSNVLRVSHRTQVPPDYKNDDCGFRLAHAMN